jgi:hypothetical protein
MLKTIGTIVEGCKAQTRKGEQGNVLFLILIAVALFAALSYAVTQSSRTGGGATDGESNLVNSAQITQYPASVRTAIVRMNINGIDAASLNFDRPADFGTVCDAAPGPCVFHPTGGGATSVTAPPEVMADGLQGDWIFTSDFAVNDVGTSGATNAANDVIAFLPGVNTGICARLNVELGITSLPASLANAAGADDDQDGVPDVGVAIANIPVVADEMDNGNTGIGPAAVGASKLLTNFFDGQPFGCADFDSSANSAADADLVYYHVLLER